MRVIVLKVFSLVITSWGFYIKMFFILQNELKSVSLFPSSREVLLRLMLLLQMPWEKDWLWWLESHFWVFHLGYWSLKFQLPWWVYEAFKQMCFPFYLAFILFLVEDGQLQLIYYKKHQHATYSKIYISLTHNHFKTLKMFPQSPLNKKSKFF